VFSVSRLGMRRNNEITSSRSTSPRQKEAAKAPIMRSDGSPDIADQFVAISRNDEDLETGGLLCFAIVMSAPPLVLPHGETRQAGADQLFGPSP
jgi:hypothetical protein